MSDLQKQLKEKKAELEELIKNRPKATCTDVYSSENEVRRETRIEELEEEIAALEKQATT
jgi:polyhydroxyalkanoate synthesis regulator phasin